MQAANLRHHLGAKPEVFEAVYEDCIARVAVMLSTLVELGDPERPGEYLRRLAVLVTEAPDLVAFLAVAPVERRRHPELQRPVGAGPAGLEDLVRSTVARWSDEGRLALDVDPASLADVLIAITYGTLLYGSLVDPTVDLHTAVMTLSRLVDGDVWRTGEDAAS